MGVLLSLTVAVPLVCLALLSLLSFVGIVTLGAVIHMVGAANPGTGGRIGARSPARCRSLPSGSRNPSVEFAGPGMYVQGSEGLESAAPPFPAAAEGIQDVPFYGPSRTQPMTSMRHSPPCPPKMPTPRPDPS